MKNYSIKEILKKAAAAAAAVVITAAGVSAAVTEPASADVVSSVRAVLDINGRFTVQSGCIDGAAVELSSYFAIVNGEDQKPTVTGVKVPVIFDAINKYNEEESVTVFAELPSYSYRTEYFKVSDTLADDGESYVNTKVSEFKEPGEYVVRVTAMAPYTGSAEALFTILRKPQVLKVSASKLTLTAGEEAPKLEVSTDGDAAEFKFSSKKSTVISVTGDGIVTGLKPGRGYVRISTEGDEMFQPASAEVCVDVLAKAVRWKAEDPVTAVLAKVKETDKETGKTVSKTVENVSLSYCKAEGADKYMIEYSTSSKFTASKTKTVYSRYLKATLKKLDPTKTYYVRVRALTKVTDGNGMTDWIEGNAGKVKKIPRMITEQKN